METMAIVVKEATAEKPIQTLEGILAQIPEIERALVDVESGEVKLTFDENRISEEQIIKRVQVEGFHIA